MVAVALGGPGHQRERLYDWAYCQLADRQAAEKAPSALRARSADLRNLPERRLHLYDLVFGGDRKGNPGGARWPQWAIWSSNGQDPVRARSQ